MRSGGSIILILVRFYTNTISLIGNWCSVTMMYYLHTYAQTFIEGVSGHMVQHRYYALIHTAHEG